MSTPNILQTLIDAGFSPRQSGNWLRIPATWRGGTGYNVAVHSETGAWRDHATGEHGGFRKLCELLQTKPSTLPTKGNKAPQKKTRSADKWLGDGFPLAPLPDLNPQVELHGLSVRQKMDARARRAAEQKAQAEALEIVRKHLHGRLPNIDFDPMDCLPSGTKIISHTDNRYRLVMPVLGFKDGKRGIDAAHITNFVKNQDGSITKPSKPEPKSFIPNMPTAMRHPEGRHVALIRKDAPKQTLAVPGHDGPLFAVAEGLETEFSAMAGTGTSGIFALNADGIKNLLAPSFARQLKSSGAGLLVCGDRDDKESQYKGQNAAAALVRTCRAQGIPAWLLLPPLSFGDKCDWNDVHRRAGIDGLRAAMALALENSEKELEQIGGDGGEMLSFEGIRPCNTPKAAPMKRHTLDEATRKTQAFINDFLHDRRKEQAPRLLASDPGNGKSHALATTAKDMQLDPRSVSLGTVTPTNALADEAAANAEGIRRHGRSENPSDLGHCLIFPDIKPLSDQWRSIVAHRCQNCAHGQAAMESIKGAERTTDAKPCSHLLHISQVRQEPVVSASLAGFEGDPELSKFAGGDDGRELRHLVFDDVSALNDHRMVRTDQIATWVRTAKWASAQGGDEERAALINSLVPDLERLAVAVAGHTDGEQVALDPADWHTLCQGIKDKRLDWMDGTAPEAVHTGADGETEIPLRTLRDLCHAIERGTAWLRKGFLLFAVPTRLSKALIHEGMKNAAMVMDATPSLAVREIINIMDGQIEEIRIEQPSLRVKQIFGQSHGKTVCEEPGSQKNQIQQFEYAYSQAIALYGAENVSALVASKAFAETIRAMHDGEPGWDSIGWFGNHNRGQNLWEEKTYLLIWGVPQLSPTAAEREYMAQRQSVIEACQRAGKPVPEHWQKPWNGERAVRWARVPGQSVERQYQGYADDWIDQWSRSWTTAELVQGIGRLRATRRNVPLVVEIHANFVPTQEYGIEIDEISRTRSNKQYDQDRHDSQQERGKLAILSQALAGKDASYRKTAKVLKNMGLETIRPDAWVKMVQSVTAQVYSLFQCGNTPARLHSDDELAAAARELAEICENDLNLVLETAQTWSEASYTTPAEQIAACLVLNIWDEWGATPQDRPAAS